MFDYLGKIFISFYTLLLIRFLENLESVAVDAWKSVVGQEDTWHLLTPKNEKLFKESSSYDNVPLGSGEDNHNHIIIIMQIISGLIVVNCDISTVGGKGVGEVDGCGLRQQNST